MSIFARSTREPSGNSPFHALEKIDVLLRRGRGRGCSARLGERAAVFANFLG